MSVTLTGHQLGEVNKLARDVADSEPPTVELSQMAGGTLSVSINGWFAGYVTPEPPEREEE